MDTSLREVREQLNYENTFLRWQRQIQAGDKSFTLPFLKTPLDQAEISKQLTRSTRSFRKIQRDSIELRQRSYEQLLADYMSDENPKTLKESQRKYKIVQRTIDSETSKATFGNLRNVVKPTSTSALSQLEIPRPKGDTPTVPGDNIQQILNNTDSDDLLWDVVIDRSDIERHLVTYNREAFRAAAKSPCGHGIIYNAITFSSLSSQASRLLEGHIPKEWYGNDRVLKEFLASFAMPPQVLSKEEISTDISEDDVKKGFTHWRETTTTSPSGRHLGHYKALIQDPVLLRCLSLFLQIALKHGIAIPRWCKATNVMIEKDPGRPKINRLRIIHLFEADFNFILKLMWGHRLVR